jgi:SAM-dependent methyltransferase
MSGFSAEWLKLREPYDLRARNTMVLDAVLNLLEGQSSVAIVDLACGTGSTFRALSPHIGARQNWRLVDNDLSLLARVPSSSPGITVTAAPVDLNRDLEAAFESPADLVTTSALLDLVSSDWLDRLVVEVAARRLPVYAALSYDGRAELSPSDPLDRRIVDAVNRHQRKDKGFGPALGPSAAKAAIAAFERVGYVVTHGLADWEFGPDDREIQTEILTGWAAAAREIRDPPRFQIIDWLKRRRELIAAGRSTIHVGHVDLLACPTATR